jgi:hypothetical protein
MVSITSAFETIRCDPLELLDRNQILALCGESGYRPEADGELDPPTLIAFCSCGRSPPGTSRAIRSA